MRRLCLVAACVVAVTGLSSSAVGSPATTISGPVLQLTLPRGLHGSVAFGQEGAHPAAWILAASFPIARDTATHEGLPNAPRAGVIVSIGDFPIATPARAHWPHVRRLHLGAIPGHARWSAHVRYANRAVSLTIIFGARARTAPTLRAVNELLASARPQT